MIDNELFKESDKKTKIGKRRFSNELGMRN